jgi:DNA replication protein DnaC
MERIGKNIMINYNKLLTNLETLKLDKMRNYIPNYLESIKGQDISLVDALYELTEREIEFKDERASKIQVTVAAFPFEKEIKDFDFTYQPSINKKEILDLQTLRFIENKENILLVGSSRSG